MHTPEQIRAYAAEQGITLAEARRALSRAQDTCAMPSASSASHNTLLPHQAGAGAAVGMSAAIPEPAASVHSATHRESTAGVSRVAPAVTQGGTADSAAEESAAVDVNQEAASTLDGGAASASRRGRPALVERLTEEQILILRRIALDLSLRTDVVSHSLAVRLFAERPEAPEWLRKWAVDRHTKHHIPRSIMEAIRVTERMVAHHQAPGREKLRHLAYAPGTMRRRLDGSLMEAGEVQSWDDATVNFLMWAELGGRILCGRFQLLLGTDHATDYIVGFALVARPRDSYRAEDVVARALVPTWMAHGKPREVILEKGVWKANRVQEALHAMGVRHTVSHHPRTKLVESVFGRLWTRLGPQRANVGRDRGDDERGAKLLREVRAGRLDAREVCLSLAEVRTAIAEACAAHNRERQESDEYGRWVPEERWQAESARHLRALDLTDVWAGLPERRPLIVRAGGMVRAKLRSEWGESICLSWGATDLWDKVGRPVVVYFDPCNADQAVICDRAGKKVLARASLLTGNAQAAMVLRREQHALVRSEHVALAPKGKLLAATSDLRDTETSATTTFSRTPRAEASAEAPRHVRQEAAPAPLAARARPIAPAPEPDIDLAALEAQEAAARAAGLLPTY